MYLQLTGETATSFGRTMLPEIHWGGKAVHTGADWKRNHRLFYIFVEQN